MHECPFCNNTNQHAFFTHQNKRMCRVCISYASLVETNKRNIEIHLEEDDYKLPFELSEKQKEASAQIKQKSKIGDVFVEAVCGAGKTELVIETIGEAIQNHKRVGWAIPRRQVVLQLSKRLQEIFKTCHVVPVCQGHTQITQADLIVCTTHQLYRYYNYFDVLILDEPDAFPFKGNTILQTFAKNSVIGPTIYLSATPSKEQIKQIKRKQLEHVVLYERPFKNALTVPSVHRMGKLRMFLWLKRYLNETDNQTLVFLPTIQLANQFSRVLSIPCITSKSEQKEEIIHRFINQTTKHLLTTTILERGVTFSNIHVVVVYANHPVFDVASLIQISGRVGRDKHYPTGECIFLIDAQSKEVNQCIKKIKLANYYAYGV